MKATGGTAVAKENLSYLEDYIDTVESLPLELQRQFTLMQEMDARAQSIMSSVSTHAAGFVDQVQSKDPQERIKMLKSLNELLVECLRQGEEKVALATAAYDIVDRHVRRLDDDLQKYEDEQMIGPGRLAGSTTGVQTTTSAHVDRKEETNSTSATTTNKKGVSQDGSTKKRKADKSGSNAGNSTSNTTTGTEKQKGRNVSSSGSGKIAKKASATAAIQDLPIDPNEPLYCYCQQVSYGEMVACDNGDCEIEWFHLSCAGLKAPPKGKWYCKDCSQKSRKPQKK